MFGGGPYSVAGSSSLRTIGKKKWPITEISIDPPRAIHRAKSGLIQRQHVPPFMPTTFRDSYHPGGNSLCYMIQTAHLMGCDPIYCLGFTLSTGTGYFFGRENPVNGRMGFYPDPDRAVAWLRWYESRWPGRARLWPGWSGPVYEALEVVSDDEVEQLVRGRSELQRAEPVAELPRQPVVPARRSDHRSRSAAERQQPPAPKQPRRDPPRRPAPKGRVIGGRP